MISQKLPSKWGFDSCFVEAKHPCKTNVSIKCKFSKFQGNQQNCILNLTNGLFYQIISFSLKFNWCQLHYNLIIKQSFNSECLAMDSKVERFICIITYTPNYIIEVCV